MKRPKWKQRQLKAKTDAEAAEQRSRHAAFWAAVPAPKLTRKPIDFDRGLPTG